MSKHDTANGAMNRLKRSRMLHLGSLMATASFTLAACGSPQQNAAAPQGDWEASTEKAYASVEECQNSGEATAAECVAAFNEAEKNAPKFASQAECEEGFGEGQCQQRTDANGTSMFMPLLAGFVLGRLLSGGMRGPSSPLMGNNTPQNFNMRQAEQLRQNTSGSRAVSRGGFGGGRSTASNGG